MSVITIVIIVAVIIGAVALGLVFVARRMPKDEEDPLQARLAEFTERGEQVTLEEIEMSQPFTERVLYPMMRKFGEISSKFTPQKVLQDTTTKLELAGNPGRIDASTFYSGRFHCRRRGRCHRLSFIYFFNYAATLYKGNIIYRHCCCHWIFLPATLA